MGIPRFIKLPSHKRFEYSPRYWDPEKEEREERIRQIKQEMGIDVPSDPGNGRDVARAPSPEEPIEVEFLEEVDVLLALSDDEFDAYLLADLEEPWEEGS